MGLTFSAACTLPIAADNAEAEKKASRIFFFIKVVNRCAGRRLK